MGISTSAAAEVIGCDVTTVCRLIRSKTLKAKKVRLEGVKLGRLGYFYRIDRKEAERVRDLLPDNNLGWPRGKPRGRRR